MGWRTPDLSDGLGVETGAVLYWRRREFTGLGGC